MFMPASRTASRAVADLAGRRREADDVERRPQRAAGEDRHAVDVDEQAVPFDVVVGASRRRSSVRNPTRPASMVVAVRRRPSDVQRGRRRGPARRGCAATSARRPATRTSPLGQRSRPCRPRSSAAIRASPSSVAGTVDDDIVPVGRSPPRTRSRHRDGQDAVVAVEPRTQRQVLDDDAAPPLQPDRPPRPDGSRPGREARDPTRAASSGTSAGCCPRRAGSASAPAASAGRPAPGSSARQRIASSLSPRSRAPTSTACACEHRSARQDRARRSGTPRRASRCRRSAGRPPRRRRPAAASKVVRNHQSCAVEVAGVAARRRAGPRPRCPAPSRGHPGERRRGRPASAASGIGRRSTPPASRRSIGIGRGSSTRRPGGRQRGAHARQAYGVVERADRLGPRLAAGRSSPRSDRTAAAARA